MTKQEALARQFAGQRALQRKRLRRSTPITELARAKQRAKRSIIRNPRVQFAAWLQEKMPEVWAVAEQAAKNQSERLKATQAGVYGGAQLGGFMDFFTAPVQTVKDATTATTTAIKSTWEKLLDGAIAGGTAYLTYQNQKDMLALNIERAKAGLPPLDAAATAPVIRTVIDMEPELAREITGNIGSSINRNMMVFGGLALVALIFFGMRK